MSIERHTDLDPKRFNTYADTESQVRFFFDNEYDILIKDRPERPEAMTKEIAQEFVEAYTDKLDFSQTTSERFDQLKTLGQTFGFAPNNAEFKQG